MIGSDGNQLWLVTLEGGGEERRSHPLRNRQATAADGPGGCPQPGRGQLHRPGDGRQPPGQGARGGRLGSQRPGPGADRRRNGRRASPPPAGDWQTEFFRPSAVPRGHSLRLTPAAAAELCRQAAVAGTPGLMHLDLLEGACEAWAIRLRPAIWPARPWPGPTASPSIPPATQLPLLRGLQLDYKGDLSGGGFLVRSGPGVRSCACGAAFSRDDLKGTTTK